jgi:hypothetical protein
MFLSETNTEHETEVLDIIFIYLLSFSVFNSLKLCN